MRLTTERKKLVLYRINVISSGGVRNNSLPRVFPIDVLQKFSMILTLYE